MSQRVVVYSKPGCHLCEEAVRLLQGLQHEFNLTIDEIDITHDRALFKQYFEKIPVILVDDRVTLAAPIRLDDLRAALKIKL